jgi:hypothetical protein
VTGPDIDIETIESATVDFGAIQERDTRMLSNALGLPIEMLNEGSDGLGSGKPAEARLQLFALQNEAARRRFCDQFKREFLDEILSEYSPFNPEREEYGIHIKSFLDDKSEMASLIQQVGDYLSANEVREKLDMPPVEDEEIGESYRTPAEEEAPDDAGGGGLFGSAPSDTDFRNLMRRLQTPEGVPSNAQGPVSDRSEVPEGASTFDGPAGGLYYVPADEEPEQATNEVTADPEEIQDFQQTAVEEGDEVIIEGPEGEQNQVTVDVVGSDDAFVVEDAEGNREVIEPNGETRNGQFEAVGLVGGENNGGAFDTSSPSDTPAPREVIEAPLSEGGLRKLPDDTDGQTLASSVPTIDERFDEELEGMPVSPDLDLDENDVEATREAMAQQFDSFQSEELLEDYFSRMSHIHGHSTDDSQTRGSAIESQALGNEGNVMASFQVTNPSLNDKVVFHEQMHTIHNALGYSSSGESAGGSGGFQEYDSPTDENEDAKPIENALMQHENDDAPPLPDDSDTPESLMNDVAVTDGVPETADREQVGDALQEGVSGTPEEQFRTLVSEVNKAFLKTQGVKDREGRQAASRMVKRPYQMTNTNEFMAVLNETMQKGEGMHVKKLARSHPEMVNAYTSVFDVPDETKDELSWFTGGEE